MSSNKSHAIENAVLPRDARLPSDIDSLLSIAVLSFCPVKSVARRARMDHIASLIDSALMDRTF